MMDKEGRTLGHLATMHFYAQIDDSRNAAVLLWKGGNIIHHTRITLVRRVASSISIITQSVNVTFAFTISF
jgi:hypothetical protein